MPFTTGILLFDGVEELDFAGPYEVLTIAKKEGDSVVTIAATADPITGFNGLKVVPDHGFDDAPALDVLLVPGGMGTRPLATDATTLDWIKTVAAGCTWVTSVCTGAILLHAAGLLAGKQCTTHWGYIPTMKEESDVTVLEDVRYVRDGNVVTAAGVSAGIDMSLWLVGQMYDVQHARDVQLMIEYNPAPPYAAIV
ncbi:MAG: DJ-1/PfpI family protein [Actinobacteria bacterium]|nr:DJ-1/PfpI family protein [Actinomycetota bacterium]